MATIEPATHESQGVLYCYPDEYADWDGLRPYWSLVSLVLDADGLLETECQIAGEDYDVTLAYSKCPIAARPQDSVDGRLYEIELHLSGRGERKLHFNLSPRFPDMEHADSGDPLELAWQHVPASHGYTASFDGSNVALDAVSALLAEAAEACFDAADERVRLSMFDAVQGGRLTALERYVRIRRDESKKLTRQDGLLHRLAHLLSNRKGSQGVYKWDNTEAVGYIHQFRLSKDDPRALLTGHGYGRQIKCYLPREPESFDEDEALYHPKLGVLFKQSLNNDTAVPWGDRHELVHQLDETIANVLSWAGISTEAGGPPFVGDKHFDATATLDQAVAFEEDPTPQLEAEQEHLLVTALRDLTDSDLEIIEHVATDGGQPVDAVADAVDRSISTVYRALERVGGILESDDGHLRFGSAKIAEEIRALVDSVETQIESAADRVGELYGIELSQAKSDALAELLARYDGEVLEGDGDAPTVRFDVILSELKSSPHPRLQDVVAELRAAWVESGKHRLAAPSELWVEWRTGDGLERARLAAVG